MELIIRQTTQEDSDALLAIYTPYVRDTSVSFELTVPSGEEFRRRVAGILQNYPYFVCLRGERIVGYAYASRFRERAAYRYSVETSVYVAQGEHGGGIGSALYDRLFSALGRQGFCSAYAGITVPNEKSLGFHIKQGFTPVGTFHRAGYKFGRWSDVLWMERLISDVSVPPDELLLPGDDHP